MRLVQKAAFAEELIDLAKKQKVSPHSCLKKLSPFIDADGLIRVNTRLADSQLPYDYRFPVILPKTHHLTELLIHETHRAMGHQGANAVMSQLRNQYWVIGAKNSVKKLVRQCILWQRYNAGVGTQIMAALPNERHALSEPFFTNTSVDLFGHFAVKRARTTVKRYVALFCCMTSGAVHVEPVFSLEMEFPRGLLPIPVPSQTNPNAAQ